MILSCSFKSRVWRENEGWKIKEIKAEHLGLIPDLSYTNFS